MSEGASIAGNRPHAIGPGRLVLVIGPSGVGKDTLINLARDKCRDNPSVVFPSRTVTRESSQHEENRAVTPDEFLREGASGAFVATWQAHGHSYGIARELDQELIAGRTAVLNVSRGVVDALRMRYANVAVVKIFAPSDVVAARLAARGRSSDGDLAARIAREHTIADVKADVIIENAGAADAAAAQLLATILSS